jgi:predicted nucleic acid-binding protein
LTRKRLVFDTDVVIRHRFSAVPGFVSAVVLQELAAGARDGAELRRLGAIRMAAETEGVLLTPDGEDWFQAGKVLNSLLRGVRSVRGPRSHAIDKGEQRRLVRDVLIARSARRVGATVVSYNVRDFEKIQRFCNVHVAEPEDIL